MIKEELDERISAFEQILQKVAGDIASGLLSEKSPPSELLKRTEQYVNRLDELAASGEDLMLVLKPERASTIRFMRRKLAQTLTTFKDILLQNTSDPPANSRLAFEQLRKALTDSSDFSFLMREVRNEPSSLIDEILSFEKASEAKTSVISIQAPENFQPVIKYILGRIDDFRTALIGLEKKVDELKKIMRELQEESMKILSGKSSAQSSAQNEAIESKTEKKQLSLSNFKVDEN